MPLNDYVKTALDMAESERDKEKRAGKLRKLGLSEQDIGFWTVAKSPYTGEEAQAKIHTGLMSLMEKSGALKSLQALSGRGPAYDDFGNKLTGKTYDEHKQAVSYSERFGIKQLINNSPEAQQYYLGKKGYETELKDGKVYARRTPEQPFGVVDPVGIDPFDFVEVIPDAVEATALAVLTAAKTGPGGLIAAPVAGGLSAGIEAAKQYGGLAAGFREKVETADIKAAGAIGAAVPGFAYVARGAARAAGEFADIASGFFQKLMNVERRDVTAAASRLGLKTTVGQRFDTAGVREAERTLIENPNTVGGTMLRRELRGTEKELGKQAEGLISREASDVGGVLTSEVSRKTKNLGLQIAKLKKAETLDVQVEALQKAVADTSAEFKFSPAATGFLKQEEGIISGVKTTEDLANYTTALRRRFRDSPEDIRVAGKLLLNNLDEFKVQSEALRQASQEYSVVAARVRKITKTPEASSEAPVNLIRKFIHRTEEENLPRAILREQSPKAMAKIKEALPESFEAAANARLSKIRAVATKDGYFSVPRFLNEMDKVPEASRKLILGDDANAKLADIRTFSKSMPKVMNPSGSGRFVEALSLIRQIKSIGASARYSMIKAALEPGTGLKAVGGLVGSRPAIAGGLLSGREIRENAR